MQNKMILGAALGALLVAGCASSPPSEPAPVAPSVAAQAGNNWTAQLEALKRALEESTRGSGVRIVQTADNQLQVVVPADLSFDTGRTAVNPRLARMLDQIASGLLNNPAIRLRVIGHTDNVGGTASNERLSLARATAVRDHLTTRGLANSALSVEGRGEMEPTGDNRTSAGRAQNRRVEIFVAERARN